MTNGISCRGQGERGTGAQQQGALHSKLREGLMAVEGKWAYITNFARGAAARHLKFRIPVGAFSHCMGFVVVPQGVFFFVSRSLHCAGFCQKT